jgi:single-strand DNA-binding protein
MNLNQVLITGNLVEEPKLKEFKDVTLCKFTMAYNRNTRNKETGEWESEPHFFDVDFWDRSKTKSDQLNKGTKVFIKGMLKQTRWSNENGDKRSKVEINATTLAIIAQPKNKNNDTPF